MLLMGWNVNTYTNKLKFTFKTFFFVLKTFRSFSYDFVVTFLWYLYWVHVKRRCNILPNMTVSPICELSPNFTKLICCRITVSPLWNQEAQICSNMTIPLSTKRAPWSHGLPRLESKNLSLWHRKMAWTPLITFGINWKSVPINKPFQMCWGQ